MMAFISFAKISYKIMVLEINFLHWNLSVCNDTTIVSTSQNYFSASIMHGDAKEHSFRGKLCVSHTAVTLVFLVISVCLREMAWVGNRTLGKFSRVMDLQFYKTLAEHGARNQEESVRYVASPAHWGLSEQFRRPSGFHPSGCSDWFLGSITPYTNLSLFLLWQKANYLETTFAHLPSGPEKLYIMLNPVKDPNRTFLPF